ncbi:MAG: HD domain-containing protein [Gemmatimonadetes bacterium]|nr:HD domain-containing protein [Gemmatimonadota bacterium]
MRVLERESCPLEVLTVPKGQFIKDLREGSEVEGVFLVQRKSTRRTREGRPFLTLVLSDRSGIIDGCVWDDAEAFGVSFSERDYLRVRGFVDRYRDRLQLRVLACARCSWQDLSAEDFLPAGTRSAADMRSELRSRIASVSNAHLRALLESFEQNPTLINAITLSPAASSIHHDRVGGLLEHTLSLMALAEAVSAVYPDLDRDLLQAGAFLHDVGKIRELDPTPGFPYTDEGRLVGHVVLGYELAMLHIDGIEGFPAALRTQVGHLILSHQGEHEWGAPALPMTLEALVLHFLDNLDAKVEVYRKAVGARNGEGKEAGWTDYVRTLGRALYQRGEPEGGKGAGADRGQSAQPAFTSRADPPDLFESSS